jgi:hypothetical protein
MSFVITLSTQRSNGGANDNDSRNIVIQDDTDAVAIKDAFGRIEEFLGDLKTKYAKP